MQRDDAATIVVFCQDPRFVNDHFRFIEGDLNLHSGEYLFIATLGGASAIADYNKFEPEFGAIISQILFYLDELMSPSCRIVLINHEDCLRAKTSKDQAEKDLREAAENIRTQLFMKHQCEIELWYANLRTPGKPSDGLRFERLSASKPQIAAAATG